MAAAEEDFLFTLRRVPGKPMGFQVKHGPDDENARWLFVSSLAGEVVQERNAALRAFGVPRIDEQQLRKDDCIININGKTDPGDMMQELTSSPMVHLRVSRRKEPVPLAAPAPVPAPEGSMAPPAEVHDSNGVQREVPAAIPVPAPAELAVETKPAPPSAFADRELDVCMEPPPVDVDMEHDLLVEPPPMDENVSSDAEARLRKVLPAWAASQVNVKSAPPTRPVQSPESSSVSASGVPVKHPPPPVPRPHAPVVPAAPKALSSAAIPAPVPVKAPSPEPAPVVAPAPAPEPAPVVAPAPAPEPAPELVPVVAPAPAPEPTPVPVPAPEPVPAIAVPAVSPAVPEPTPAVGPAVVQAAAPAAPLASLEPLLQGDGNVTLVAGSDYDPDPEPETGYLKVAAGQAVVVIKSARMPAESGNLFQSEYIFGHLADSNAAEGGWLPLSILKPQ